jgi:hypothetical protein
MKSYVGVPVYIHVLLTSVLVGDEWPASRSYRFSPGGPRIHWIGGRMGPRAGLNDMKTSKFLILLGLGVKAVLQNMPVCCATT